MLKGEVDVNSILTPLFLGETYFGMTVGCTVYPEKSTNNMAVTPINACAVATSFTEHAYSVKNMLVVKEVRNNRITNMK